MQNPHILVLDEVSNHLDMESIDAIGEALNVFKGMHTLVWVSAWLFVSVCVFGGGGGLLFGCVSVLSVCAGLWMVGAVCCLCLWLCARVRVRVLLF